MVIFVIFINISYLHKIPPE